MAIDRVDAYIDTHRADFLEQLKALIRIPSVAPSPPTTRTPASRPHSSATTWRRWGSRPS